jgi:hypothetical protein
VTQDIRVVIFSTKILSDKKKENILNSNCNVCANTRLSPFFPCVLDKAHDTPNLRAGGGRQGEQMPFQYFFNLRILFLTTDLKRGK